MAANIGPKIGIDGEAKYRAEMQRIIQQGKTLEQQMEAVTSSFDDSTTAEEKLARQSELTARRIETQRELVGQLQNMVVRSTEATGENSTATLKWQEALARAESDLNRMEHGTDSLGEAMDEAGDKARGFGDVLKANLASEAIVQSLKAAAGAVKAVGEAAFSSTKDAGAYADEMLTLSATTGLSTEQLQEFKYMQELVDVSLDTMTGSMRKLIPKMASARKGEKAASEAFSALGVSVTGSNGALLDSRDVFFSVIDALGEIEDPTERDALAMEIFGKSAQDLNPLILQGSKGLRAYAQEAHDVGYVLDDEMLGKLAALDDSFQRLDTTAALIKNRFGAGLAPSIEKINSKLVDMAQNLDWEAIGTSVGGALEQISEKAISFVDNVDFEKVSEDIEGFFGYIDEHGESVIGILEAIGTGFLAWEGFTIAKTLTTDVMGLVGSLEALAAVLGVSAGTLAGGSAVVGVTAAGVVKEISDITSGGTIGANQELEEYRANVEKLQATYDELVKRRDELPWFAPAGTYDSLNRQITVTLAELQNAQNEYDAALAAVKAETETLSETNAEVWGEDMVGSYANGMMTGYNSTLKPTLKSVADAIASYFHHSEPDIGPLSDDASWMPDMMRSWARGISDNKQLVLDEITDLASAMASPTVLPMAAGGAGISYGGVNVTIYANEGQSADELYDVFTARLQQDVAGRRAVYDR